MTQNICVDKSSQLIFVRANGIKMFFVLSCVWNKKKFWVPMRNWTSDLQIPYSDVLPLSHRDSTVSKVYHQVHMTRVLHTAGISNVDSIMGNFFLCPTLVTRWKRSFSIFFPSSKLTFSLILLTINGMLQWLKQLHFNLSSSIHMVYWHNPCWLSYWKL